ncbi:SAM-dependent methyltransferase [Streptomyces sp. bgisy022]|uniref:SAM-dependent methyltransferase n=1 Tax=Streptomyces sp. bgisy022 TaxID=3413769 RepID=UPI003D75D760
MEAAAQADPGTDGQDPRGRQNPRGRQDLRGWRAAAQEALYGPDGFYRRPEGPAGHFRTSVHASPLFARAVARLLCRVDEALGRPGVLDFVDLGAGRGELVTGVLAALPAGVADRTRAHAIEIAARPAGLDERIVWRAEPPPGITGLLFANEWLDNVPLDVAEVDGDGVPRLVLVAEDGTERLGPPVTGAQARWLARWWPLGHSAGPAGAEGASPSPAGTEGASAVGAEKASASPPGRAGAPGPAAAEEGLRAEIGLPRDRAWASAVRTVARGLAVAVDYGHTLGTRPPFGTLTGFREGRETAPVPDGSCDLTAHVALDACAAAVPGPGGRLLTQREALRVLGLSAGRPPLALASTDPAGYVRALAGAGQAAELLAPDGLGAFGWLVHPVDVPDVLAA